MSTTYLDDDHRLVRYVPWARLLRDEDDNVLGALGGAFALREDEDYLSATWPEYFSGSSDESLRCAIEAIRDSKLDVRPKARFAIADVRAIKEFMNVEGKKIRVIHEPEDDNAAHVAVRRWPVDDEPLLERLAEDIWCACISKQDADALPLSHCAVR